MLRLAAKYTKPDAQCPPIRPIPLQAVAGMPKIRARPTHRSRRIRHPLTHMLIVVCCLLSTVAPAAAQTRVASEAQLREVQSRIRTLAENVRKRTGERDALTASLAALEKELATVQSRRRQLRADQADAQRRLQLAEERARLQRESLSGERAELARQLRAAYTSGRQERIKLILNQQDPAQLGRMMVYYRYLNDERLANIDALSDGLQKLLVFTREAAAQREALAQLAGEADALIETLAGKRRERSKLLAEIEQRIADENRQLDALNQQEQDLAELLAELANILSDYPISSEEPITALRGKLTWPVAGKPVRNYGQSRAGGKLRSKGIVLSAEAGTEVRAIYHGRIAYADWLPGMGLLIIVDHGDGLLSLYGYNQTLQKAVGDWISPGDVIATVGNTGGQTDPALYFELRNGTTAVNPRPWFRNRPGADRR